MDFDIEVPELIFNKQGESYDDNIATYFDIDFWFKLMLLAYAASQFERFIFFVGDKDGASSMNIILAIIVIGGGFQMLIVKSRSSYELQKKLGQLEKNMMGYLKANMNAQAAKMDDQAAKMDEQTKILKADMENQTREIEKLLDAKKSWF